MFIKYPSIENSYRDKFVQYSLDQHPELRDATFVVTEKVDGCLHGDSRVLLVDGSYQCIRDIVDNKLDVEVLGMDEQGNYVPSKITDYFVNGKTKDWRKVTVERFSLGSGPSKCVVVCTPNHQFYVPDKKCYVACDDLDLNDEVLACRNQPELSFAEKQIIIGKMLGDASYSQKQRSVSFSHKKQHEEYLDYTLKSLGYWAGNRQKNTVSGHGTEMCRGRTISSPVIQEFVEPWIKDGKKIVPKSIIGTLSPIALAFWYMDDGTLSHDNCQEDRIVFSTCGFTEEDVDNILSALELLDIKANKRFYDYLYVVLNADSADKLFTLIKPYIPICMQYKLPEYYRSNYYIENFHSEYKQFCRPQKVLSIEKYTPFNRFKKYDITTTTHNFFANNVLVHNSNIQLIFEPGKVWRVASRNRVLGEEEDFFDVWNVLHCDWVLEFVSALSIFSNKTRQTINLYGELCGPGIQRRVDYGSERQILFFDVAINGGLLPAGLFSQFMNLHGYSEFAVPVLDIVQGLQAALDYDVDRCSCIQNIEGNTMEGVVIKPRDKVYKLHCGSTFLLKKKNEKFAEREKKVKVPRVQKEHREEVVQMHEAFLGLINDNRLKSVFSKEGEIEEPRQIGKYIKLVMEDAKKDFFDSCDVEKATAAFNKDELKFIFNVGNAIVGLLKEYL
jgi:Rnl2 family RNA ligase